MIMKRFFACLTLLSGLTIASTQARADLVTLGPVTVDDNSYVGDFYFNQDVLSAFMRSVYAGSSNDIPYLETGSFSFAFDLAPGWRLGGGYIGALIDFGTTPDHYDIGDWVVAFYQQVIFCPSSSAVDCTGGLIVKTVYRGFTNEPVPDIILNPNAVAGPGTAIYSYGLYAFNASFSSFPHGPGGLSQQLIAPAPEPSSFVLLGSGAVGAIGTLYRRRRVM